MSVIDNLKSEYWFLNRTVSLFFRDVRDASSYFNNFLLGLLLVIKETDDGKKLALDFKRKLLKVKVRFYNIFLRLKKCVVGTGVFLAEFPSCIFKWARSKAYEFCIKIKEFIDSIPLGDFGRDKEIRVLILIVFSVLMLGVFFSIMILCFTTYNEKLYLKDFCLSDKCVSYFFNNLNSVSIILQSIGWLITLITTVGGISIALMTYKTGVKNSSLTNHISHLNMFRDYVNAEIAKRKFISPDKINIYKWYSLIFPLSKMGDVSVSFLYKEKIEGIIAVVMVANEKLTTPSGKYIYTHHQINMLDAIGLLGIKISTGPKNEFILIEEQVFELIDCINLTFTDVNIELSAVKRAYI